jgi:hypothetical protein
MIAHQFSGREKERRQDELKLDDRVNLSKLGNCLDHPTLLVRLQVGKHGQREDLVPGLFRHGEVTTLPVSRRIGLLKVNWNGIVDPSSDSGVR